MLCFTHSCASACVCVRLYVCVSEDVCVYVQVCCLRPCTCFSVCHFVAAKSCYSSPKTSFLKRVFATLCNTYILQAHVAAVRRAVNSDATYLPSTGSICKRGFLAASYVAAAEEERRKGLEGKERERER